MLSMPRGKVEKLSISIPASQAAHMRMQVANESLKGVSDYFQRLIAEDIRKTKRRAAQAIKQSELAQQGLQEAENGELITLDPKTIDLIVQKAVSRIMEAAGEGKANTSLRKRKAGDI